MTRLHWQYQLNLIESRFVDCSLFLKSLLRLLLSINSLSLMFFFFNDTATTEIYTNLNTLSLHDALPISSHIQKSRMPSSACDWRSEEHPLNSSHIQKSRMLSSA